MSDGAVKTTVVRAESGPLLVIRAVLRRAPSSSGAMITPFNPMSEVGATSTGTGSRCVHADCPMPNTTAELLVHA